MQVFPITARLLAAAVPLILGIESGTLAQQEPRQRVAPAPSALPPLQPLPPPPAEPPSPPPPPETKVDITWQHPGPPEAATPPAPPAHRDEPERRWYGWQILLTDGAALASIGLASNGSGWGDLALALYLGGGPVVHFAHENGAKGLGSLGLRVVAPVGSALVGGLLGAMVGGCTNDCGDVFHPSAVLVGAGAGFLVGLLGASIVDVAVLAYDAQPVESRAHAEPLRLHLAPVAGLPRDSTGHVTPTVGLVGSF
jgi:hypothetical protein